MRARPVAIETDDNLRVNEPLLTEWLIAFLRDEIVRRRGFTKAVVGLSGGVDSSLVAFLLARALGPENVYGIRMPYRTSSQDSLDHAALVAEATGINMETIEITDATDGYLNLCPDADGRRRGNVMARIRMIMLFDQSQKLGTLPVGTGNKTERLFGYFTWHADDSPPVNPLGDLYKTQVWAISNYIGVPDVIVNKPASADLIVGQTDEGDFGISYPKADRILFYLLRGFTARRLIEMGFPEAEVALVKRRLDSTHWKRHMPTVAMLSSTSINDYYLRPVDY
jgi:NAD+ synthetase